MDHLLLRSGLGIAANSGAVPAKPAAGTVLKVLFVEDCEDDVLLEVKSLERSGYKLDYRRVQSAAALEAGLQGESWDAVISDFRMPGFTGLDALRIVRARGLDIPFILLSGAIGEETAVTVMKAGASDYVMKGQLARLAPALERELREATIRAERAQAQVGLRMLSHAVLQSPTATVITDTDGRILYANPKFVASSGYAAEELIGSTSSMMKSGLTPAEVYRDLWDTIRSGKTWRGAMRNRRKCGELYWEDSVISPLLDERGEIVNFIALKEDITLRLGAEEEIRTLNASLERRVEERTRALRLANAELESFSQSVSHDLRAPLVVIQRFAAALRETITLQNGDRHYVERIAAAAERMENLIDDLLNLSRIARADFTVREIDLSALALEVLAELHDADPARRCQLTVQPGMRAHAAPNLLRIALTNLAVNAWKFSSGRDEVAIEIGQEPGSVSPPAFYVRDHGAGFDPAHAGKLFNSFQRLHSVAEFPGTGIGLAIVRRVIERHGGTVAAESVVDQGATFRFTLPAGHVAGL